MGAVKQPRPQAPDLLDSARYQLADVLNVTLFLDKHKITFGKVEKQISLNGGFKIDTSPVAIDGVASRSYAAIDMAMGGDLHLYVFAIASKTISNFTTLWISSKSPPEPLQSAFRNIDKPLPLLDFLKLLEGNTMRGYWTDHGKKWRELSDAAHLDLIERGSVDSHLRTRLKE